MRRDELTGDITQTAFDFFYWFSRFEFCLKENRYLKNAKPKAIAEPGWAQFVAEFESRYQVSTEARALLRHPPERQIVGPNGDLTWRPVGLNGCTSELAAVVRLLKAVRNNLFHGGKHGSTTWDNKERTQSLLQNGEAILGHLAALADFENDYKRLY